MLRNARHGYLAFRKDRSVNGASLATIIQTSRKFNQCHTGVSDSTEARLLEVAGMQPANSYTPPPSSTDVPLDFICRINRNSIIVKNMLVPNFRVTGWPSSVNIVQVYDADPFLRRGVSVISV